MTDSHARLDPRPSELDEATFVATYGDVYEHSPWIARACWQAGLEPLHDHPDRLADAMAAFVDAADAEAQIALIRAHPDLAGRLGVGERLTDDSASEQAGAGLDRCTPEEYERFTTLNERYRERFGFPFVMAVKGHHRQGILEAFERRVDNDPETERRTAIEQIHRIARLRLRARAVEET